MVRLRELEMLSNYESFLRAGEIGRDAAGLRTAPNGLSLNEVNSPLLAGDARDLLVLANRRDAPSLHRTLLGTDAFERDRLAVLCWAHEPQPWSLAFGLAMNDLRGRGANLVLPLPRCGDSPPDLVLVSRQAFLSLPADLALPLVRSFEEGASEIWLQVLASEVAERTNYERTEGARIGAEIRAGVNQGWTLVILDWQGETLCIGPEGVLDIRTPALLLEELRDEVALRMPFMRSIERYGPDQLHLRAARGTCSAVWASPETHSLLLPALERDSIPHQVAAVYAGAEQVRAMEARVVRSDAENDRDLAALRQQLDQDRSVALENARRDRLERNALQQELRARYSQEARAVHDRFTALIQTRFEDSLEPSIKPPSEIPVFTRHFPRTEAWLAERGRGQWQLDGHRVELVDYGTSLWSDRRLEIGLVEVTLELSNSLRGERDSHCLLLGLFFDDEFGLLRDPVETLCDRSQDVISWQRGNSFETRWTIAQR
jgi:hypothetical protein